jgi:hypothetical protein
MADVLATVARTPCASTDHGAASVDQIADHDPHQKERDS